MGPYGCGAPGDGSVLRAEMILLGQLLLDASRAGVENLEAAILRYRGESLERGLKAREGLVERSCHPFATRALHQIVNDMKWDLGLGHRAR